MARELPANWREAAEKAIREIDAAGETMATRKASLVALNAFAPALPELMGGSADLTGSNLTKHSGSRDITGDDASGNYVNFGVREFGMTAISNGLGLHGGVIPYAGTFLTFSDYSRNALRMAALMKLRNILVFTHDSIGLGEDGPTHQPIEHLASMRATPGLRVIRPADANETAQAWAEAIAHNGPTVLVLSRQGLPTLAANLVDVGKGATIVAPGDDAAILASGSEVEIALAARDLLAKAGRTVRVVSMPCMEIFRDRPAAERAKVLPPALPTVAVEAAAPMSWYEFADAVVGLTRFGASAPAEILYQKLGITAEAVAERVSHLLDGNEVSG
jgi:transketolase